MSDRAIPEEHRDDSCSVSSPSAARHCVGRGNGNCVTADAILYAYGTEVMEHVSEEASSSSALFFSSHTPVDHPKEARSDDISSFSELFCGFTNKQLEEFFRIEDTVKWICDGGYKRVALQLPDRLLCRAAFLATIIETKANVKSFVLADTSYRSCCVDEVAAAHASCDAIVHYGDACLSALTQNIPVKFVFGNFPVDFTKFADIRDYIADDISTPLLLLTDACYSYKIKDLNDAVRQNVHQRRIFCADIVEPTHCDDDFYDSELVRSLGRLVPRTFCEATSVQICFVGDPASPLISLWLMVYPQCTSLLVFNPRTSSFTESKPQTWRQLRKRLFLVEKLRDASTVGLVVGSVGVKGHVEAMSRVREMCKAAGKRVYVISVGKVNVPKLSNFLDIEVFVLLSCPFGIILDSSDYFRPVLSMFEAEVALNPSRAWSGDGKWSADYTEFMNDSVGVHEDDNADLSLVTGKIRTLNVPDKGGTGEDGQLLPYDAGDYFKNSTWRGLDDGVRLDESTQLVEGRKGTASGYDTEPKQV